MLNFKTVLALASKPLLERYLSLSIFIGFGMVQSNAAIVVYTNFADWETNTIQQVETFEFTPVNVSLADEVDSQPGENAQLGSVLTFDSIHTGLSVSFVVTALEGGAGLVYDDQEGVGDEWDQALSIGDINNRENDDFRISFSSPVYSFSFILSDNSSTSGESITFYRGNTLVDSLNSGIPASPTEAFWGFVSAEPFDRLEFDEGSGGDDIALKDFAFGQVPEPSVMLYGPLSIALLLCWYRKKRRVSRFQG